MKPINKNIVFYLVIIIMSVVSCKKEQPISEIDLLRNGNEDVYSSTKLDSAQAITSITQQKLQELYDISALYTSGNRNTAVDTVNYNQIQGYFLKKDSANGRLLLWKVAGQAIMEQPWNGTGLGGFPAAYAEAQAEYFTSGKASETERIVAGCPEYGFNEFLQIGVEQGLAGVLFFVLLLSYSLFRGVKNRQIGASGGILALIVFALASYPLQLPEFWVVLVVLMGMANVETPVATDTSPAISSKGRMILSVVMIGGLVMCCGWIFWQQKGYYQGYKKWNTMKMLYTSKAYEVACEGYEELVPLLGHKPELLFEAAQCLSKMERFEEANRLLERAMRLSGDPMIHYMAAKNEQSQGNYQKAEKLLLYAIDMLPERIYPYYLLTKLYSEKGFFQEDKFFNAAEAVLKKEPKVESTAIREMRTDVVKLIDEYSNHTISNNNDSL